jgi:hypothetical protein
MAEIGSFNKNGVESSQVQKNGTKIDAKVEEFKKTADGYDNKVSSAKNVTIDLSVFLEDMKFDHQVDGGNNNVDTLDEGPQQ